MSKRFSFQKLKDYTKDTTQRAFHQNVRLAVTGFSGAGKSSFITSLIQQLIYSNKHHNLPFFQVSDSGRLVASKISLSDDLTIQTFPYDTGLESLASGCWPASTNNVSSIRLVIKYKVRHPVLSRIKEKATLTLDIVDYPGEWLLDLLMLDKGFLEWSKHTIGLIDDSAENPSLVEWKSNVDALDNSTDLNKAIEQVADVYRKLIKELKEQEYLVSPGRFLIPGALDNTPILDFFPVTEKMLPTNSEVRDRLLSMLELKYEHYKAQVVQPFFEAYFKQVDRQVVLVDCVNLVRKQLVEKDKVAKVYASLLPLFNYGTSNFLSRLFKPKVDKLLFAATKSDQIPVDQQFRLQQYLKSLFYRADAEIKFLDTDVSYLTLSAIKATEPVVAEINEKTLHCVKGVISGQNDSVIVYPGQFPESIEEDLNENNEFDLPDYGPPALSGDQIPHIRMDKSLEYLIGDLFL